MTDQHTARFIIPQTDEGTPDLAFSKDGKTVLIRIGDTIIRMERREFEDFASSCAALVARMAIET